MSLAEIKETIERLSEAEQTALTAWLDERDRKAWDRQMEEDFSDGGPGSKLLEEVDSEIDKGHFQPLG